MHRVTLPYDPAWRALPWVQEYCVSYITNDTHQDGNHTYDMTKVDFFFGDHSDAVMFALRWL